MFDRFGKYLNTALGKLWKKPLVWGPLFSTLLLTLSTSRSAHASFWQELGSNISNWVTTSGKDLALGGLQATANGFLNMILQALAGIAALVADLASNWMDLIAGASSGVFAMDAIKTLWNLAIGAANSIFLLALLVMAIAIMLRKAGGYDFKKAFSMLLVAILGANATFLVVQTLDALARFFTNLMPTVFGQGPTSLGDNPVFQLPSQLANSFTELLGETGYSETPYIAFIFAIIIVWVAMWSLIRAMMVLVERLVQLVVQMLIGPFIFAFSLFSGNDNAIKKWFSDLFNWALVLPLTFFFFSAAAVFFQQFDAKQIAEIFVPSSQAANSTAFAPANTADTFAIANPFTIAPAAAADDLPTSEENPLVPLMFLAVGLYLIWYAGRAHELVVKASDFTAKALGGLDKYAVRAGLGTAAFAGLAAVNIPTNLAGIGAKRLSDRLPQTPAFRGARNALNNVAKIRNLGTQVVGAGRFTKEYLGNFAKEQFQKPLDNQKSNAAGWATRQFDNKDGIGKWMNDSWLGKTTNMGGLAKNLMRAGLNMAKVDREDIEDARRNPRIILDALKDDTEQRQKQAAFLQVLEQVLSNNTIDPQIRKDLLNDYEKILNDPKDTGREQRMKEIGYAADDFNHKTLSDIGSEDAGKRNKALQQFRQRIDQQIQSGGGDLSDGVPTFTDASPAEQAARYDEVLRNEYTDIDTALNFNNAFEVRDAADNVTETSAQAFDRLMQQVDPADFGAISNPYIAHGINRLLGNDPGSRARRNRLTQLIATVNDTAASEAARNGARSQIESALRQSGHFNDRNIKPEEIAALAKRMAESYNPKAAPDAQVGLLNTSIQPILNQAVNSHPVIPNNAQEAEVTQVKEAFAQTLDRLRRYDRIQSARETANNRANLDAAQGRNVSVIREALRRRGLVDGDGNLVPGQRDRVSDRNTYWQSVNAEIDSIAQRQTRGGNNRALSTRTLSALEPAAQARVITALRGMGAPRVDINQMTIGRAQELLRSGVNETNRLLRP